jgi:hypothetical protein
VSEQAHVTQSGERHAFFNASLPFWPGKFANYCGHRDAGMLGDICRKLADDPVHFQSPDSQEATNG